MLTSLPALMVAFAASCFLPCLSRALEGESLGGPRLQGHRQGDPLLASHGGEVGACSRSIHLLTAVERQGDPKRRSARQLALHLNRAAVLTDNLFANRQTQARA